MRWAHSCGGPLTHTNHREEDRRNDGRTVCRTETGRVGRTELVGQSADTIELSGVVELLTWFPIVVDIVDIQ